VLWATDTIGQSSDTPDANPDCKLPADIDEFPPNKRALELELCEEREAAEAGPHASKEPESIPVLSCPSDVTDLETGIAPHQPGPFGRNIINEAQVISSDKIPYRIFAGALDDDPQRGRLIVLEVVRDACAVAAGLAPAPTPKTFTLPVKSGAATITAIEGDLIAYETASGTKGRFRYPTGEFLPP
jgi:hypothetical protein